MGRWGDRLYESDGALDYFAGITDRIMREIYYLFSPERVKPNTAWVIEVVTVIEIMLLFAQKEIGSAVYLMDEDEAIERWRGAFFSVWDAEWNEPEKSHFPFHAYAYRQAHRDIVIKWFDRLDELSLFLGDDELEGKELKKFISQVGLPYFSLAYSETKPAMAYPITGFFLSDLIEWLKYSVVFVLSDENRKLAIGFFQIEDVWVAVDVMALLCETYACSPSVTYQTIEIWRKKMTNIWKARLAEEAMEWEEHDEYKNVVARFDQLKALAQKHPPMFS